MPLYDIINKKTGEDVETVFMSWASLQEYLKDNPENVQKVGAPAIVSKGTQGALQKAGDGWKEVQDKIKSNIPKSLHKNIKTK
jgi:hypothetical protein